ncbi:helix-turn-helix domain-containing protein [Paracraurococcus lichenis]|uniref:Helix-turn-helix transcriptional regulator n=1 Tax=Paracraurococcus lichenis TaxID=3064888 RepID=A0ABT9DYZ9_9PROT|nr:helix-turn-helix transcriptional regulator [Paracraurococcus sp. LOR1-02]MDO9708975.1 helix-turn-helix transcriptional regulator [Paracraurococcus sp. LOR1-02]
MPDDAPPMAALIEGRLDRLDLTPEEASRAAGLAPDFLERLMAGRVPPPRGQRLVRLAEVLATSVSYLVGLDPDTPPPQEVLEEEQGTLGLLAGDEEALLRAYRRLEVPQKAAVVLVVRSMAGPEPAPDEVPAKRLARR